MSLRSLRVVRCVLMLTAAVFSFSYSYAVDVSSTTGFQPVWQSGGDINIVSSFTLTYSPYSKSTNAINITGNGNYISGNSAYIILNLGTAGNVTVDNLTLRSGKASANGGAVYVGPSAGNLYFTGVTIIEFSSSGANFHGGGLAGQDIKEIHFGTLATRDTDSTVFRYNAAPTGSGGAMQLFNQNAANTIVDFYGATLFDSNLSKSGGGAILMDVRQGSQTLVFYDNASFINNLSSGTGGAVNIAGSGTKVAGFYGINVFSGNKSLGNGGAISAAAGTAGNNLHMVFGSSLTRNSDKTDFTSNGALTLGAGTINGGALHIGTSGGDAFVEFYGQVAFSSSVADGWGGHGGAINIQANTIGKATLVFYDSVIFEGNQTMNTGGHGGAIAIRGNAEVTVNNGQFINNSVASGQGGAVYLTGDSDSRLAVLNFNQTDTNNPGIFQGNTAGGISSAISLYGNSRVNFNLDSGTTIDVYDRIVSDNPGNNIFTKNGEGTLNFYNDVRLLNSPGNTGTGDLILNGGVTNVMVSTTFAVRNLYLTNATLDFSQRSGFATADIKGEFVMDAGSVLKVRIDEQQGEKDAISASSVTLAGTLSVFTNVGTYDNFAIEVIESGDMITTFFDHVLIDDAALSCIPDYITDPYKVYIIVNGISVSDLASTPGLSFNGKQAAVMLDYLSGLSTGDLSNVITHLKNLPSDQEKRDALLEVSPHFVSNIVMAESMETPRLGVFHNISADRYKTGTGIWAEAAGNYSSVDADGNSPYKFKDNSFGAVFGCDFASGIDDFTMGLYGQYKNHSVEAGASEGTINSYTAGLYAGYIRPKFEVKALLGGGGQTYETRRKINISGMEQRTAEGSFGGSSIDINVEAALKYGLAADNKLNLRPYLGFDQKIVNYGSFKENGAQSMNIDYNSGKVYTGAMRIGAGVGGGFMKEKFKWNVGAEFHYLMSDDYTEVEAKFENTDDIFLSRSAVLGSSAANFSGDVSFNAAKNFDVYVRSAVWAGGSVGEVNFSAGLSYAFGK